MEKAIISTLILNGPQTYNDLYKLISKKFGGSTSTFTKYLKTLVEQGKIYQKIDGQYREYSISTSKKALHSKLAKLLDELIADTQDPYVNVEKFFKKYQKSKKYSKIKHEEQNKIFFHGLDSVNIILRWYQLLLLITVGGFATSDTKQKARYLQKKYNQQLQELFQTYRKIDSSLARMIFSNILDELYPRNIRPGDLEII